MSTAYRRPADVAVVVEPLDGPEDAGAAVYLARLPDGPILVLTETAAAIWLAATQGADDAMSITERLARRLPDAEIAAYVEPFVAQLLDAGLLEVREP